MIEQSLLTAFVLTCLGLLVLVCGYFVKSWIENLGRTIKELSGNVHDLTEVVGELKQEQAVQRVRIRQQATQIRQLQEARGCTKPDCPFKDVHLHTRFTDDTFPGLAHHDESGAHDAL